MTYEMITGLALAQIRNKDKSDIRKFASQKRQSFNNRIAKMRGFYKECFKSIATRV